MQDQNLTRKCLVGRDVKARLLRQLQARPAVRHAAALCPVSSDAPTASRLAAHAPLRSAESTHSLADHSSALIRTEAIGRSDLS
jgi:hypothetical protein